jgi:hypothetical protein
MRFTNGGGLFRAAYYLAHLQPSSLQSWEISTLVCYASSWNRLLNRLLYKSSSGLYNCRVTYIHADIPYAEAWLLFKMAAKTVKRTISSV